MCAFSAVLPFRVWRVLLGKQIDTWVSYAHLVAKSHSHAGLRGVTTDPLSRIICEITAPLSLTFNFAGEIMEYQYKNFHALTENAIIALLCKQNYPSKTRGEIIERVREEKKHARSVGAKRLQHRRLWEELISPLHYEMRLVKRMQSYNGSAERAEALNAYMFCMEKVHSRMVSLSETTELMPTEVAKDERLPNNGIHWTDWVKPKVKEMVLEMFGYIPRGGVKVKTPFERRVPDALHAKLKKRLLQRTQKEYDNEYRKQAVDYTDAREAQLKRMKNALEWVNASADGEALPVTWHGFYK